MLAKSRLKVFIISTDFIGLSLLLWLE